MLDSFPPISIAMADITHFLAGVLWIVPFTLILHCDSRPLGFQKPLTTKLCPGNETEWEKRSDALNCSKKNGYMCLPNDNFTELVEICYRYPRIIIKKGVCLYLNTKTLLVDEYKCHNFTDGCPNSTYFSYQAYNYQLCMSIQDGCFLAEQSCVRRALSTYKPSNIPTTINRIETLEIFENTNHISVENRNSCWVEIEPFGGTYLLLTVLICIPRFYRLIKNIPKIEFRNLCKRRGKGKNEPTWTTLFKYVLPVAYKIGKKIMVRWLSKKFADQWDVKGDTRLHDACKYKECSELEKILKQGVDVNIWDHDGMTPLHLACYFSTPSKVGLLVKNHADVNAWDLYGNTPLHFVCQTNKIEIAELLIKEGANINQCNHRGTTPLDVAEKEGRQQIVDLLSSKGAKRY